METQLSKLKSITHEYILSFEEVLEWRSLKHEHGETKSDVFFQNDLYRRQTELMYMKREHRLEEEHADIEYQIR